MQTHKTKLMKNLLSGKYTMINIKWVKLFTVTFQRRIFKYATNNIHYKISMYY